MAHRRLGQHGETSGQGHLSLLGTFKQADAVADHQDVQEAASAHQNQSRAPVGVVSLPRAEVVRWLLMSLAAATCLFLSVLVVAVLSTEYRRVPVSGPPFLAGNLTDALRLLGENALVLTLYAVGCLAAFLVRRHQGDPAGGSARDKTRTRLATAVIIGLLVLAACRQAYVLGHGLAGFSAYFYVSPWRLWLAVLPHAIPELTGMLLPLPAWLCASRKGELQRLAAVVVSAVLVALPLLASAALIEVYVSPKVFRALTCIGGKEGFAAGTGCGAEEECPKLTPQAFEKRYGIKLSQDARTGSNRHCDPTPRSH